MSNGKHLYRGLSQKSPGDYILSLKENALKFGFTIHSVVDMRAHYQDYEIDVSENFEVYSVVFCNPKLSFNSITRNPERAAVIAQQRQAVVYRKENQTVINYLPLTREYVREVLPHDETFADSVYESSQKRIKALEISL